jgi:putative transposase
MSHNGCQPAVAAFMPACATLEIHQVFTSYSNPKGDADTERVMRTLKEECLWLQEWACPFALLQALEGCISYYNEHYLHFALGYKAPARFERDYHNGHSLPFLAA